MDSFLISVIIWLYLSGMVMTFGFLDEVSPDNKRTNSITAIFWPGSLIAAYTWYFVQKLRGKG